MKTTNTKFNAAGEMISCMYWTKNNTWKFWSKDSGDMSFIGLNWNDSFNASK